MRLMDLSLAFGIGVVGLIYILLLFTFFRLGPSDHARARLRPDRDDADLHGP